ncbi:MULTISPECIES: M20 family metallopeptidase [Bacillaceae]|uniref:M20 family metallopeptidase n=1 Tax=Bacillaceae TaxID=186817 RepID=UPI001E5AAD76|nr:M20 family metallopeptidase [Bacillus sp. Au-Bac7]MCE4049784.1 M20 family metallopeptidase [Bacillus sp. Au-Bac7]
MSNLFWITEYLEETKAKWSTISDYIWDHPETRFEEFASASYLKTAIQGEGFTIHEKIGGMETAFMAEFGSGTPVFAFLGEFDALSGLSQADGTARECPLIPNGNGHGCGHNLLGTGAMAAAVGLKNYVAENNIPCTIRYYGCPGEEGGSGKTFMVRAGAFDDVDCALTWHPNDITFVMNTSSLANIQVYFRFKGKSAHAAGSPHLGRSALDAVELMNIGSNYMREHIIDQARIHYAITNSGGLSPNVVQGFAEVLYLIRAPKTDTVIDLFERVKDVAKGAALMTGTEMEVVIDKACSNYIPNNTLNLVMQEAMLEVGPTKFTAAEKQFATEIQATLTDEMLTEAYKPLSMNRGDSPLFEDVLAYEQSMSLMPGSTDVSDVSWVTPTAQCNVTTCAIGTPFHTWQLTAQGKSSSAHKGTLQVAKILFLTAAKLLKDPELLIEAKKELQQTVGEKGYVCPIPDEVQPAAAR